MSDEQESPDSSGSEPKKGRTGLEVVEEEKEPVIVFQFNDEEGEFQELEIEEDLPLRELLDSEFILLFIHPEVYRAWVWQGSNTTTRMKFISAIQLQRSSTIRAINNYSITVNIGIVFIFFDKLFLHHSTYQPTLLMAYST